MDIANLIIYSGLSGIGGFIIGWAMKTLIKVVFKILAVIAGLFIEVIAWLQSTSAVTITVNWPLLNTQLNSIQASIHTIAPTGVGSILTLASLPTIGGGLLGFLFGFLKG